MIHGTIELISNDHSTAGRVEIVHLARVPQFVEDTFGVTSTVEIDPVTVGSVTTKGAWRGNRGGAVMEIRLWEDIPFEETAIGKALAAGAIDPLNPDGKGEG